MKKIMTLVLSICMIIGFVPLGTFAKEVTDTRTIAQILEETSVDIEDNSVITEAQVNNDLENLAKANLLLNDVTINNVDQNGLITYELQLGSTKSLISIIEEDDGTLIANVKEGSKENIIEYLPDGSMVVDGSLVTFSISGDLNKNNIITPMSSGTKFDYSETPFYGQSASDYNRYVKTLKVENIGNGSLIKDWAAPTIASAIAGAVFSGGVGVATGFLYYLGQQIANSAKNYNPTTAFFSYEIKVYEYKNSTSIDRYYLYDGTYCLYKQFNSSATGNYKYKVYENKWIY